MSIWCTDRDGKILVFTDDGQWVQVPMFKGTGRFYVANRKLSTENKLGEPKC